MSTAASEYILAFDVMRLAEAAFSVDKHHRITAWNDAAERLFGCPSSGLIGLRCRDVMGALHLRSCAHCAAHDTLARTAGEPGAAVACTPPALAVTPEKGVVVSAFAARSLSGETRIVHLIQVLPDTAQGDASRANSADSMDDAREREEHPSDGKALASAPVPHMPIRLTQREHEILDMLAKGRDTSEIADTLSISRVTARNHIAHVIAKLGASTRLQAVIMATRVGLL